MKRGAGVAIQVLTLLVLSVSPWWLFAQTAKPPSLKEQLEAQFPAETVLVIQKTGVLGVALASSKTCAAKYQDGKLSRPDASCTAPLKDNSRPFPVGQKVNPGKIDIDLAKERISLQIVECGSCNKGSESSPYKSQIDFQFGKGYLEKTGVSQIEDTISEVLAFDAGADQQAQGQPGEPHDEVLTNSDVVKMVKVKLADGIIISKIKTSACNFDTSVNALVKLKEAGVSDPVIQAMHDAQEAARAAANEPVPGSSSEPQQGEAPADLSEQPRLRYVPSANTQQGEAPAPTPAPGQVSFSFRHRHSNAAGWFVQGAQTEFYCSGTLSVSTDGTVAYDCAQTEDPSGRCEHLSFAPGALKQVKIGLGGNLHLASKTQGNVDLYGNADDIKQAQAAIAPLIQK